jgi:hypothetical protein
MGLGLLCLLQPVRRMGVVSKVMGGKEGRGGTHVSDDTMHIGIEWQRNTRHEPFPLSEMRSVRVYR